MIRSATLARRGALALVALLGSACAPATWPSSGTAPAPAALNRDPRTIFAAYLAQQPAQLKMRHQVESTFGDRHEIVQGVMLLARPRQFWLRALGPLGTTLFDVRQETDGRVVVTKALAQLDDERAPILLARDIARIYLDDCPPDADLRSTTDGIEARCTLPAPLAPDARDPPPDTTLRELIAPSGLVQQKCFFAGDAATACVRYREPTRLGDTWLAREIELVPAVLPYRLRIVLLDADPSFDVGAAFGRVAP
ncbi:MAG: hypothetical protein AAB426_11835 [Myxococcota bacterium]